ncbi:unnamed protein product [Somion occarium]|uniref:Uncharacterized protein n=1 Tax=Somion occarium TaxID=3059160 RepID=A0ABP1D0J7_9APHY
MCCAYGSRDQAIAVCPMCKVFKPSASRCPHKREVCRNRALHPKHDVVYLKNPEVQLFSGCGYCKWARLNPAKAGSYNNNGWPGCCRPPTPEEHRFVGAADWPAVSLVHRVPIPPDIKALLDSISTPAPPRGSTSPPFPSGSLRGNPTQSSTPPAIRRATYNAGTPTRNDTLTTRTAPMTIPFARSGGSPQQLASSLTSDTSRDDGGDTTSSSLPNTSTLDQLFLHRRSTTIDARTDKRGEAPYEAKMSPGRKYAELGGSLSRKGSGSGPVAITRRPSISAAMPSMYLSKVNIDAQPARRRVGAAPSTPPIASSKPPSPPVSRPLERQSLNTPSRRSLENSMAAVRISSASSDSSGSNSETTVISDGGFTDYLSDESEAELQRQAEIKAAQAAQNQMEELEFKAARQQLAHVGLHPPKSWTGSVNATPRSQATQSQSQNYSHTSYASPYGLTSPSRG